MEAEAGEYAAQKARALPCFMFAMNLGCVAEAAAAAALPPMLVGECASALGDEMPLLTPVPCIPGKGSSGSAAGRGGSSHRAGLEVLRMWNVKGDCENVVAFPGHVD